jgi:lambda family phage portal protein
MTTATAQRPRILGPDGQPIEAKPTRARILAQVGSDTPYGAASRTSQELAGWNAYLGSPDADLAERETIVARIRDLVRNDGWASGSVSRLVDAAVGADLRPSPKPDFRSLAYWSRGFDPEWAAAFASWAKGCWRDWAYDPARWCDLTRNATIPEMFGLAFRTSVVDGEALGVVSWRPDRRRYGRGRYATTVGLVDPDRLCNPQARIDSERMRSGVELDADGAAMAYWIRDAHGNDIFATARSQKWTRWVRETNWGRPVVVHHFEREREGQHRGIGLMSPVLSRMKMLARYDSVELQAAVINAILAAYIESPFDADLVESALSNEESLPAYQRARAEFHNDRRLTLNNARIPTLFPGEKISSVAPNRPSSNYSPFQSAVLRNVAAATGQSEMEVSGDWSRVNYSSARGAMLVSWKSVTRRRASFSGGFAQQIYSAFLEEAMERDNPPLPPGAPDFAEARAAYSRCLWRGPGRGWVDPVKEVAGAQLRMEAGLSTLDHEAAEHSGADYEDILDQRAIEIAAFRARGLDLPTWAAPVASAAMGAPQDQGVAQ